MGTKTEAQKKRELADWLRKKHLQIIKDTDKIIDITEMAVMAKIEPPTFSAYYNGGRLPRTDLIVKLAKAFGNEIFGILDIDMQLVSNDEMLDDITAKWGTLDDETKRKIAEVIKKK
jgi:hypothetical protein